MLKKIIITACLITGLLHAQAQKTETKLQSVPNPIQNITKEDIQRLPNASIDFLAALPFGKGAENYSLGFGIRATYTNNPYGFVDKAYTPGINDIPGISLKDIEVLDRRVGWVAGVDYTFLSGKKEEIGTITYEFDNLSIVHVFGGVDYDPCPSGNFELSAGPAMGFFGEDQNEFGFGVTLGGQYVFTPSPELLRLTTRFKRSKPVVSVVGGLGFYKFGESDPLFTARAGIRMTF
jgi:hypothetical protein